MKYFTGASVLALAIVSGGVTPVFAQEAAQDDVSADSETSRTLDTVQVFAQKREENLQTVPVSLTAVTGDQLEEKGFSRSDDIAKLAPNVTFAAGNFDATPKVFIRGIGSNEFVQNANTGVGIYIDEVFKGLATGQTFQLYDLERVEVLRGPQSTLYGKNTSGGVINFYTVSPEDEFGVGANVTIGEFGQFETDGYINVPISEQLSTRLSFATRERDGLFFNEFTGEDEGNRNNWAVRGQALFEPTADFSALAKIEIGESSTDFKNARHVGLYNPNFDPTLPPSDSNPFLAFDVATGQFLPGFDLNNSGVDFLGYTNSPESLRGSSDYPMAEDIETFGATLKLDWSLGWADLTSITAHESVDRVALQDADYSPNAIFHNDWFSESKLTSQELRLTGENGPLQWLVGAYYYEDEHDNGIDLAFFECFADPVSPCAAFTPALTLPPTFIDYDYIQETTNYAFFTQQTFQLTDALSITGGIRYTWEERSIDATSISTIPPVVPGFPRFQGEEDWENVLGKIGIDYEMNENVFLYGSWSQGFKAGNWNGGAYNDIGQVDEPADPEVVDTFEIGAKTNWFNNTLRLNASAFTSSVDDMQVFVFQSRVPILQNAAEGEISGIELEFSWLPTDELAIDVSYGYLDATYENFIAEVTDPSDLSGASVTSADLSGNRIVQTPENSLTAAATYNRPISPSWELQLGADYSYRSDVFFTVFNDYLQQDAVGITNLRAGLANLENGFSVTAFVNNVGDERYFNDAAQIGLPFGVDELFEAYDVRAFGIRFGAEF